MLKHWQKTRVEGGVGCVEEEMKGRCEESVMEEKMRYEMRVAAVN